MSDERCRDASHGPAYYNDRAEEICDLCRRPIETSEEAVSRLTTDLARVTQERDELRKWLDSLESADVAQLQPSTDGERSDLWLFDSVLLYSFYDVDESVVGMQNINEEFANWVAAIRERSKP